MPLPKVKLPSFQLETPSTKNKVNFRPILAKDSKIILNARATNDYAQILKAVKQVVKNCSTGELNIDVLTLFDVEFLYCQLYGHSTHEPHQVSFRDTEDEKIRSFDVDFSKLKIEWPEKDLRTIKVSDTITLQLNYPSINILEEVDMAKVSQGETIEKITMSCMSKVFEGDQSFDVKSEKPEDLMMWLDDLPNDTYKNITEFFLRLPSINYEISYTNDKGSERKIVLSSLNDIFNFV